MEKIKKFRASGHEIIGISHVPMGQAKMLGVVLLCPGHQYRVGPHRMYVKLARSLKNEGYHVLRVDSEGIGDSTGGFSDKYLYNVHGRIQRGKLIKSSRQIIRLYRREYGLEKVFVSGLCGGSLTGLLASRHFKALDGIVGIGVPFIFSDVADHVSGSAVESQPKSESASASVQESLLRVYLQKALSIENWKRGFTFQIDYQSIVKAFKYAFQRKVLKRDPSIIHKAIDALIKFFDSNRQVLLIYSCNDFHYKNFQAVLEQNPKLKRTIEDHSNCVKVIDGANHTLSLPEWEQEFHRIFMDWINSSVDYDEKSLF